MHYLPANLGKSKFKRLSAPERSLILLPQLLSRVSNASENTFNNLLRIVHKYPLLEDDYSESDKLPLLYQQVIAAAKQYLGPYSRIRVRFYMRIPLIQILKYEEAETEQSPAPGQ